MLGGYIEGFGFHPQPWTTVNGDILIAGTSSNQNK